MSGGIRWHSDFTSGIRVLDQQHQKIFSLLQQIDSAVTRLDGDQAEHLVIELLDFAVSHNHLEDQLMIEAGYPQADEHLASHRQFLEIVDAFMQQIVAGQNPFSLARQVRNDVTSWITNHLMYDDLDCMRYLSKQAHGSNTDRPKSHSLAR